MYAWLSSRYRELVRISVVGSGWERDGWRVGGRQESYLSYIYIQIFSIGSVLIINNIIIEVEIQDIYFLNSDIDDD